MLRNTERIQPTETQLKRFNITYSTLVLLCLTGSSGCVCLRRTEISKDITTAHLLWTSHNKQGRPRGTPAVEVLNECGEEEEEEPRGGARGRSQEEEIGEEPKGEEPRGGARDRVYTSVFLTGRPWRWQLKTNPCTGRFSDHPRDHSIVEEGEPLLGLSINPQNHQNRHRAGVELHHLRCEHLLILKITTWKTLLYQGFLL